MCEKYRHFSHKKHSFWDNLFVILRINANQRDKCWMAYIHKDDITIGEPLHTNFCWYWKICKISKKSLLLRGCTMRNSLASWFQIWMGVQMIWAIVIAAQNWKVNSSPKILGVTKMHSYDGFYCQNMTYIKFKHNGYVLTLKPVHRLTCLNICLFFFYERFTVAISAISHRIVEQWLVLAICCPRCIISCKIDISGSVLAAK